MKVVLFGVTGMLGRYVHIVLKDNYEIYCIKREQFDIENDEWSKLGNLLCDNLKENDIVINCAGIIKQRKYEIIDMITVNSLLPHVLTQYGMNKNIHIIHITTDCVYSGLKGEYIETDPHDCIDEYGKTKSLGENEIITIIRTSIIGEENNNKLSLLEWLKQNKNKEVNGFTNHYWNGLTCLQLSKIIADIIKNDNYWFGVKHIFSNTLTKYDILNNINDIYNLNINITPIKSPNEIKRNLDTIYINNSNFHIPPLNNQLQELNKYSI